MFADTVPPLAAMIAIGAAASVSTLVAAAARRHGTMLGWYGLALAASPQAGFLIPLIVALLIGRRLPAWLWAIAPLSALAVTAAFHASGWPTPDLTTLYVGQAGWSPAPTIDAPNVWAIIQALPGIADMPLAGLALAAAIGASAWLIAHFSWRPPYGGNVIGAGLLVALIVPGLVPGMTEQSFFLADILALVLAVVCGEPRSWMICALVEGGSALALAGHAAEIDAGAILGAVPIIIATALMARQFLVSPANDNGLPLNPFRAYPA